MSSLHKTVIVAFLSVAFVAAPALASPASAPSAPLGVILQAGSAKAGLDVAYDGATIYDGDRLQTTESSSLRVRLGGRTTEADRLRPAVGHRGRRSCVATPGASLWKELEVP